MKALTLTQPWASLVALGHKSVETRSWTSPYRGPLAIHAAKGFPAIARTFYDDQFKRRAWQPNGLPWPPVLGAVVAIAKLSDVITTERFLQGDNDPGELELGDYTPGRYAWILDDVRPLARPIPARGMLGLWEWEREFRV